jgi:hypothetical protein
MPSNGQLLGMQADERTATIEGLSTEVRRKLAHIACLGAEVQIQDAQEVRKKGLHPSWADEKLRHAAELSALAAQLTADSMREGS